MSNGNPTLVVLSGSLKGEKFILSDADFSIGREIPNSLYLSRKLVSRQHAVIRSIGFEQFIIIDLDSRNGTLVNAVPVKERNLEHGDRIQIGDSLLLFLLDDSDLEASDIVDSAGAVRFDDEQRITTSLVQLTSDDSVYSNFQIAHDQTGLTELTVSNLRTLLKICTEINSTRDRVALQQRLLELIFDAVPADSGAILLSAGSGEPVATASRSRRSAPNSPVVV